MVGPDRPVSPDFLESNSQAREQQYYAKLICQDSLLPACMQQQVDFSTFVVLTTASCLFLATAEIVYYGVVHITAAG